MAAALDSICTIDREVRLQMVEGLETASQVFMMIICMVGRASNVLCIYMIQIFVRCFSLHISLENLHIEL